MMQLGIFAKTFAGSTPAAVLGAAKAAGYGAVQYNMACSGLAALPEAISHDVADAVRAASLATGVEIAAVSATYNMIHPDAAVREAGRRAFAAIAAAAPRMGTRLITVCTGSRDAADQWRHHPENESPQAWDEMCAEFRRILPLAERHDLLIGVEPELANVVSSAAIAERLVSELGSKRIKIVLDPANLFEVAGADERRAIIEDAVRRLGPHIAMAHAKDRTADGGFCAPGKGVIDFSHFFRCLRDAGFAGAVVTHGLSAAEAPGVAEFLRARSAQTVGRVEFFTRPDTTSPRLSGLAKGSTRPTDTVRLAISSVGAGRPMIFQHGLCGDAGQTGDAFPEGIGWQGITLECRGHGASEAGPPDLFSIATFTDDIAALIETAGIGPVVIGGISMGAAIALRLAVTRPGLVRAIVLARPAWLTGANPANARPNVEVGELLAQFPPVKAREAFEQSPTAAMLAREAPDNLASLRGFFTREPIAVTSELLRRIPADGPGVTERDLAAIRVPTLVIGTLKDFVHPMAFAEILTARIPGARLATLTPKGDDRARYRDDFRAALAAFLKDLPA